MKLSEVAQKLECRLEGAPDIEIRGVAGIDYAEAGQITFLSNRRYFPLLHSTLASAVLVEEGIKVARYPDLPPVAALRTPNPYLAFAHAIELFYQAPRYESGIHPTAIIARSAEIKDGAHIGPYCYVDEDVQIGRNAVLHSFVTIYRGAKIGDDFFAHAHAVVREFCRIGKIRALQRAHEQRNHRQSSPLDKLSRSCAERRCGRSGRLRPRNNTGRCGLHPLFLRFSR